MNIERIKEIQQQTAYPDSKSVQQALIQVWNECEQGKDRFKGCEELSNDRPDIPKEAWIRFMNKQLGIVNTRDMQ